MIVVFVVDTSPGMGAPSAPGPGGGGDAPRRRGISRLDVAKMSVEHLARAMDKRVLEHNRSVLLASARSASLAAAGNRPPPALDGGRLEQFDEFLLLSSSLQPDAAPRGGGASSDGGPSPESVAAAAEAHASCGAGGRLLVGPVEEGGGGSPAGGATDGGTAAPPSPAGMAVPHPPDRSDFERELKRLRTPALPPRDAAGGKQKFPEWAGGAHGLNAALSHGLGLLSRYRLSRGRAVEHFGMGRLPWGEHQMARPSRGGAGGEGGGGAEGDSPLQPACLVLLTDGECLRRPPEEGGGKLSLRFGNMPLREFYREPFRWDQRVFVLHIADASAPPLHQTLRALCEVTGGAYTRISQSVPALSKILSRIAPPKPKPHSIIDPLRLPNMPIPNQSDDASNDQIKASSNVFVNGGPVCSFQCLEGGGPGMPSLHRAMILFAGACEQPRWILNSETSSSGPPSARSYQIPVWCIPESHFPSKKLDTLPPRPSQPMLHYSRNFQAVGSPVFDPYFVMKALHHLDHLQKTIRQLLVDAGDSPPPMVHRMLQRDVYLCEWLGGQEIPSRSGPNEPSNATAAPRTMAGREHFPVCVRGAGRPALSGEGAENILNLGILHVPHNAVNLKDSANATRADSSATDRISTLTLLPPDPHILIPLLIKVAEMELRMLKKLESKEAGPKAGATAGLIKKKVSGAAAARAVHLDDNWKSDFRAYLFRLPPYYLPAMRRVLRPMLPPGVLSLLDGQQESLSSLCFSPACLLKIQQGEKAARDGNDWLRAKEENLRLRKSQSLESAAAAEHLQAMGRNSSSRSKGAQVDENFAVGYGQYDPRMNVHQYLSSLRSLPPPRGKEGLQNPRDGPSPITLLPSSCLLPYYESRRRWIFGGTGLTTQGLHVEGVKNDGVNVHRYDANQKVEDMPLIALAGVGADTTNQTNISRMGDFKERLNFAPSTFVDYGGSVGASVTTASDGSPIYSVDDDVLPTSFFDVATGEFVDSELSRMRSRLMVNFGNPFRDKRGCAIVPEKFSSQRPPLHWSGPSTPPGSPPHDAYDSHPRIEGEGEAEFIGKQPASPARGLRKLIDSKLLSLKPKRAGSPLVTGEEKRRKTDVKAKPHPPTAPSSPHPPPPPPRPLPPKRHSSSAPPPPPKPSQTRPSTAPPPPPKPIQTRPSAAPPPPPKSSQAQKLTQQKPAVPKPAPPKIKRQNSGEEQKHAAPKPAPPKIKRQNSGEESPHPIAHSDTQQTHANQAYKRGSTKPAPPKRHGEEASTPTASAQSNPHQQPTDLATQLQTPGVKPKINLPEGWICVWSKSQKRWYFFDTKTNKSIWRFEDVG